ncbi:MAG: hypothetical protein AAB474_01340 [Patescibacteria group bacterium]
MSPQTSLPEKNPEPKESPGQTQDDLSGAELLEDDFELSRDIDDLPV